jgi:hypothetical protein
MRASLLHAAFVCAGMVPKCRPSGEQLGVGWVGFSRASVTILVTAQHQT